MPAFDTALVQLPLNRVPLKESFGRCAAEYVALCGPPH
jgi:hypothetical protein